MNLIKRIILSFIIIYTYDLLAVYVNLVIPINLISIAIVSLLGVPGFLMLIIFKMFL